MIYILLAVGLVLLMLAPNWWVKRVLKKHSKERSDFPGNGGDGPPLVRSVEYY